MVSALLALAHDGRVDPPPCTLAEPGLGPSLNLHALLALASRTVTEDSVFVVYECGLDLLFPKFTEGGFYFYLLGVTPDARSLYISFLLFPSPVNHFESGLSPPTPTRRHTAPSFAPLLPSPCAPRGPQSCSPPGFLEGRARPHFRRARPEAVLLPPWGLCGSQPSEG